MTVPTLTVENVTTALDEIIAEKGPDYVYPKADLGGCFYSTPEGAPACIVGAVIAKLAPTAFQRLVAAEPEYDDGNGAKKRDTMGDVNELEQQNYIHTEEPVLMHALTRAQTSQDDGETWAQARASFRAALQGW